MAVAELISENTVTVLLFMVTLVVLLLVQNARRPSGFPPGPPALPIIGNVLGEYGQKSPSMAIGMHHKVNKLCSCILLRVTTRLIYILEIRIIRGKWASPADLVLTGVDCITVIYLPMDGIVYNTLEYQPVAYRHYC